MTKQLTLTPDADPDYQDVYREQLQESWNDSLRIVIAEYGIPPWQEQDNLLDADELRLMTLIDESGYGWIEGKHVVIEQPPNEDEYSLFEQIPRYRYVSEITHAAGFTAEANCNAVINGCIAKGYIRRVNTNTESRLMIGDQGRWRLDACQEAETLPEMPRDSQEGDRTRQEDATKEDGDTSKGGY